MIDETAKVDFLRAAVEGRAVAVWLVDGPTYFEGPQGRGLTDNSVEPLWSDVARLPLGADCRADATGLLPPELQGDWLCSAYFEPDVDGSLNVVLNLYPRRPVSLLNEILGAELPTPAARLIGKQL